MTIGSILLGMALLLLVGLFVTRPLFSRDPHRQRRMSEQKSLSVQKEAVLIEIQTLDFDYETGKITDADYDKQREAYMDEAAELLMRLDALDENYLESEAVPATEGQPEAGYDEIEAAIARRRAKAAAPPAPVAPAPAAPVSAAAVAGDKAAGGSQTAGGNFCPQCGESADAGDRFCAYCGHQLAEAQHA